MAPMALAQDEATRPEEDLSKPMGNRSQKKNSRLRLLRRKQNKDKAQIKQ